MFMQKKKQKKNKKDVIQNNYKLTKKTPYF